MKSRDVVGQKFGRWLVVSNAKSRIMSGKTHTFVNVVCECGAEREIAKHKIVRGHSRSCGCLRDDLKGQHSVTHGLSSHPFYYIWKNMMRRATDASVKNYAARGITVCSEWHDPAVFIGWLESNGYERPLELDRIDNDGDYSPENCRIVTRKENNRNKRTNLRYTIDGVTLTAVEISEKYGVPYPTVTARIKQGRDPRVAI